VKISSQSLFHLTYRLRGWGASSLVLLGAWSVWPSRSSGTPTAWSAAPVLFGLALRLWARRYIGLHSRGSVPQAPCRVVGGPYRFVPHPLYVANVLVVVGLLGALLPVRSVGLAAFPVILFYAYLAHGESLMLARENPPLQSGAIAHSGWRKEIWSVLPPLALWFLIRHFGKS
jgi:protein-S-isoprenylcysteine O-methyltransferase Ste14